MKNIVEITVLGLALIGSVTYLGVKEYQKKQPYSTEFSINFAGACMRSGSNQAYCACALDVTQDMYTFKQAKSFTEPPEALTTAVLTQCSYLNN